MEIKINVQKKLRDFDLELALNCPDDELLAVIGPSGSGKTTIIRMIAGLEKPDEGCITFGDEIWFDAGRNIHVSPQKRRLGYVFQDYTLFPHLTLGDNAAFAAADRKRACALLEMMGISHLRNRKPNQVSGGERQRCAICQALAYQPRALLLDEPFSALDFITRRKLRDDIKALRKDMTFPVIYVTHDIAEAFSLADRILPVVDGKIDQGWLTSAIAPAATAAEPRAARTQRLALAF